MKDTTLLVMAAGMGSRFGGLKQMEPFGKNGETILDYSVFDALDAGFNKIVLVIKKSIEKDFREHVGKRLEAKADIEYVFQELDKLPKGFTVPDGRTKPWGTGHAVLCARDVVKTPFAAINADDFYGAGSYKPLHDCLASDGGMCMVGFRLGNTLSENGTVSRGVCDIDPATGLLKSVTEMTSLDKNSGIPLDTTVSMNMWGFGVDFFDVLEEKFVKFLENNDNPLKGEFYLPFAVDELIHEKNQPVKVFTTEEKWYGVTYKEDKDDMLAAVKKLSGRYGF